MVVGVTECKAQQGCIPHGEFGEELRGTSGDTFVNVYSNACVNLCFKEYPVGV